MSTLFKAKKDTVKQINLYSLSNYTIFDKRTNKVKCAGYIVYSPENIKSLEEVENSLKLKR